MDFSAAGKWSQFKHGYRNTDKDGYFGRPDAMVIIESYQVGEITKHSNCRKKMTYTVGYKKYFLATTVRCVAC